MNAVDRDDDGRRILFVTPVMPAETGGGLAMRCGMFLEAAAALGPVDVLVTSITATSNAADVAFTRRNAARLVVIESQDRVDSLLNMIMQAAEPEEGLSAFARYGKPAMCHNLSSPVLRDAAHAVSGRHYDLCIVMRLYSLPVLQAVQRSAKVDRIVCDLDDDDSQLAREMAASAREHADETRARWHEIEADNYDGFLDTMSRTAHGFTVASPLSLNRLSASRQLAGLQLVPNAIAVREAALPVDTPRMLIVGTLNYKPNEEGLIWFLSEVLPGIRREIPKVETVVAGRRPSAAVISKAKSSRAVLKSDLPDLGDLYRSAAIALTPILSGSGTRIKILEAGAYGVAMVSTDKGAEGLALRDGEHCWITPPDPEAFAAACVDALRDPEKRAAMARRLREHVVAQHERGSVMDLIRTILESKSSDQPADR